MLMKVQAQDLFDFNPFVTCALFVTRMPNVTLRNIAVVLQISLSKHQNHRGLYSNASDDCNPEFL